MAKIQEAHHKAKTTMKSLPFVGFSTSQRPYELRSLGAFSRLPEQLLGSGDWREARGKGFVYLQSVPYYLSEPNKELLSCLLVLNRLRLWSAFWWRIGICLIIWSP